MCGCSTRSKGSERREIFRSPRWDWGVLSERSDWAESEVSKRKLDQSDESFSSFGDLHALTLLFVVTKNNEY